MRWQGSCLSPGWRQGAHTGGFSRSQFPFSSSARSSWPRSKLSRTVHANCGVTSACVCLLACVCSHVPGQSCLPSVLAASPSLWGPPDKCKVAQMHHFRQLEGQPWEGAELKSHQYGTAVGRMSSGARVQEFLSRLDLGHILSPP